MRLLAAFSALATASAFAGPVLDTRNLPEGVGGHVHGHTELHLSHRARARHEIDARALGATGGEHKPSGSDAPMEDNNQVSSVSSNEENPAVSKNSPVSKKQDSPVDTHANIAPATDHNPSPAMENNFNPNNVVDTVDDNHIPYPKDDDDATDTPAEDVIELLDKLYGGAENKGGPSDDWRDQWVSTLLCSQSSRHLSLASFRVPDKKYPIGTDEKSERSHASMTNKELLPMSTVLSSESFDACQL